MKAIVNVERRKRFAGTTIGHAEVKDAATGRVVSEASITDSWATPAPKTFAESDARDRSDAPAAFLVVAGVAVLLFLSFVGAVDLFHTIIAWVGSW